MSNEIDDHIRQMYVDKIIDMKEMIAALKVISDVLNEPTLDETLSKAGKV